MGRLSVTRRVGLGSGGDPSVDDATTMGVEDRLDDLLAEAGAPLVLLPEDYEAKRPDVLPAD